LRDQNQDYVSISNTEEKMRNKNKWYLNISTIALLATLPTVSIAEEDAKAEELVMEEVVVMVSANKRLESQVTVPMGVTAIGAGRIEELGIRSAEDYLRFVPAVNFGVRFDYPRGGVQPNIRGAQIGEGVSTAMYLNDVPLQPLAFDRVGLPDPAVYDVSRVEVLKGPQGTLYGSASIGGLIKVVTNAPEQNDFNGSVNAQVWTTEGGGNGYQLDAHLNIPIVDDKLALRIVGTYSQDDGYIKGVNGEIFFNEFTNRDTTGTLNPGQDFGSVLEAISDNGFINNNEHIVFRAEAEWLVSDTITARPLVFIQDTEFGHGAGLSGDLFANTADGIMAFPVVNSNEAEAQQRYEMFNLPIEFDFGWGTLLSSTGFFNLEHGRDNSSPGILFGIASGDLDDSLTDEQRAAAEQGLRDAIFGLDSPALEDSGSEQQFVQELRLTSEVTDIFDGVDAFIVAGGYYRDVKRDFNQSDLDPALVPILGFSSIITRTDNVENYEEFGLFADASFDVNNSFRVSGGLRYYDYQRDAFNPGSGRFGAGPNPALQTAEGNGLNYSASVSYYPNGIDEGTLNIYARVASGFRPAFAAATTVFPADCQAQLGTLPEGDRDGILVEDTATNYEIGIKGRTEDGRFTYSGAVFQIDWSDLQSQLRLDCGFTLPLNVGEARTRGFEAEFTAGFGPIDINAGVGYVDAELTETSSIGNEGDKIPLVGEWSVNASIKYSPEVLSENNVYFLVDYTYQDSANYGFSETSRERESLGLVGARIGATFEDWMVEIYGRNLTNQRKLGQCFDSGFPIIGERVNCINVPRVLGVRVARDF